MRLLKPSDPVSLDEARALFSPLGNDDTVKRVLLACSGGPDSTALVGLFAQVIRDGRWPQGIVVTVDHGLRDSSAAECEAVRDTAVSLGLPCHILRWTGAKPQAGIQEAAREARYGLLADLARRLDAQAILTGHTLDDQAETVLMRLFRGSGPAGLAGMAGCSPKHGLALFRPFLSVPKARLIATCHVRNWLFVQDPSNENPRFLRTRIRRLMPALAAEGLSETRIATLANRLRRAESALDELTADWRQRALLARHSAFSVTILMQAPPEVLVRILAGILAEARVAHAPTSLPKLERIERLAADFRAAIDRQETFARTLGGLKFAVRRGTLTVSREKPRRARELSQISANASAKLGNGALRP